jgi:hypothetical protein
MNDLIPALRAFRSFFTVKRVVTLLIVALALVLVCSPQYEVPTEDGGACDAACPFPRQPVINIPPVVITTVDRENWSFTLMDEGWVTEVPSIPEIRVELYNKAESCMVLLIKEKTDFSLQSYVVESILGFNMGGKRVHTIKQVKLGEQKFVLLEGNVAEDEVFLSWNTVKDGFGYSFCCFYSVDVDAGTAQKDACQAIAESLQIK